MSARHVGGTRGSGIVSSAADVVVCHDQVRLQVSQGFRCRDS